MISKVFTALSKYGTYPTLRKAVLRIRRSPLLNTYAYWIRSFECVEIDTFIGKASVGKPAPSAIKLRVILHVCRPDSGFLSATFESLQKQSHKNWELICINSQARNTQLKSTLASLQSKDTRITVRDGVDRGQFRNETANVLRELDGGFVMFVGQDDLLHPRALECLAAAICLEPDVNLLYTDEDKIDANGNRFDPYFKPHWNPELLLSQNYVNCLSCWRSEFLLHLENISDDLEGVRNHRLLLRAAPSIRDTNVFHIPFPLYHQRTSSTEGSSATSDDHLALTRVDGEAIANYWSLATGNKAQANVSIDSQHDLYHSNVELAHWPEVTLVIPHSNSPALLQSVLELWTKTDYPNLNLVLVDHSSTDSQTREMLDELAGAERVTICDYQGPFNFSRMCNLGVRKSNPDSHICFLNNDVQLLEFSWLKTLVPYLEISGVVAVGPLLLYPDYSIQHAGIALGIGGFAGHYFKHLPYGSSCYQRWAYSTRNTSALTGAALLTRRSAFDSVGGFDEEVFPTSFSDVDLCLKLSQRGRLVFCPDSKLIHLESQTRPKTDDLEYIQRLREKWGNEIERDPCFPTIFSRLTEIMTPDFRNTRPL
ncbi:MAG: glycosyltransferase [Halioglobus sp.]|nr:glycosyltransferase [Halioglobus sp.]